MKAIYNILVKYLPRANYSNKPVLCILDLNDFLHYAYSFDPIKKVILISNSSKTKFRYVSLYEFCDTDLEIIPRKLLYPETPEEEEECIPFRTE